MSQMKGKNKMNEKCFQFMCPKVDWKDMTGYIRDEGAGTVK